MGSYACGDACAYVDVHGYEKSRKKRTKDQRTSERKRMKNRMKTKEEKRSGNENGWGSG